MHAVTVVLTLSVETLLLLSQLCLEDGLERATSVDARTIRAPEDARTIRAPRDARTIRAHQDARTIRAPLNAVVEPCTYVYPFSVRKKVL